MLQGFAVVSGSGCAEGQLHVHVSQAQQLDGCSHVNPDRPDGSSQELNTCVLCVWRALCFGLRWTRLRLSRDVVRVSMVHRPLDHHSIRFIV